METRILNSLSLYPQATSPFLLLAKMACRFSVENQFYWRQGIGEIVSRNSDGGEQQSPESRRPGTSFPVFPFFSHSALHFLPSMILMLGAGLLKSVISN